MSNNPDTNVITLPRSEVLLLRREAGVNQRPLLRHLVSTARYLGIGALVHAWFLGSTLEQHSLWSWGYLLAWPVPLFFWFLLQATVLGFYAVILIVSCAAIWWGFIAWLEGRERRAQSRDRARAAWKSDNTDPRGRGLR